MFASKTPRDLFGTMDIHVAVIEWDSSEDPSLFAHPDLAEVRRQMREAIERIYGGADSLGRVLVDEVGDFVNGPGLKIEDWDDWHSQLHDIDGTPWVTETVITIPIQ